MPDRPGRRRQPARSELIPILVVALLGALLLGAVHLRGGDDNETSSATDPVAANAEATTAVDPARPRHDADERATDPKLIEPLDPGSQAKLKGDANKLRIAAESHTTKVSEVTFRVATFNVLASQHTAPGGSRASWPDAGSRTAQTVGYIKNSGVDIVGLQEVKSSQLSGLTAGTGFRSWPGGSDPDNSVIWNPAVFDFVSGDAFYIRFMHGTRLQPIVRLRHKKTKVEFFIVNMHASAGGGQYAASRAAGHAAAVSTVNRLKSAGIPIFLTGDMNDRATFFCRVLPPTGMVAAVGGSTSGGCRPPGRMPVDWIVATPHVSFSSFSNDQSTFARRVSDHAFVSATATVRAR